jgi:hypothetical protein
VPNLVTVGTTVQEKKNGKCKSPTDRRQDDGQRAIRKAHLSFHPMKLKRIEIKPHTTINEYIIGYSEKAYIGF